MGIFDGLNHKGHEGHQGKMFQWRLMAGLNRCVQ